jgi:hypothetical protein
MGRPSEKTITDAVGMRLRRSTLAIDSCSIPISASVFPDRSVKAILGTIAPGAFPSAA